MSAPQGLYGLMADFETSEELLAGARRTYEAGYRRIEAYTPLHVEGLSEALGKGHTWVPLIVLLGGLTGCFGGFFLQYWIATMDYAINVGGRPLNSWPSFIPVTFELTVLIGSLSAFLGFFFLCRLPRPYHPVFNVPKFEKATDNRFFLCIEATDPNFSPEGTRKFLSGLNPYGIYDVEE